MIILRICERIILPFILIGMLYPPLLNARQLTVTSPDQAITVTINDEHGKPQYSVSYLGKKVIASSALGFTFKDRPALSENLVISDATRTSRDQTWQQPWGESRLVRDHHNEMAVTFTRAASPIKSILPGFVLRVRVFNDGLGFRYEVPVEKPDAEIQITDELTEFTIAEGSDSLAWWIPSRGWNRYEYLYQNTTLEAIDRVHTPFTLQTPSKIYLSIHEAALIDFAAITLDQGRPGRFKADLTPWSDGIRVKKRGAFTTPWRTIQISNTATGLLNSRLILNLNEPNKLGDVSWVKPGKYIGIWWGMHLGINSWGSGPNHGATTAESKRYMDFAAQHGFDGVLVEGWNLGWDGSWFTNGDVFNFTQSYPDFNLAEVSAYGAKKGVKLIGHHETSGSVTNYRNQMSDAYDLYARQGVSQIKTGYVADGGKIKRIDENGIAVNEWHDGQFMVNEYLHSITEAAKRKISINTHEPIKDTGLRRTYPNWISREGARGQEFNAWGSPPNPPEHTVNLVYTRMLSGPMDFTPGIFNLAYQGLAAQNRVQTTLAKQLALYVVLYSPIQMAADLPEHYQQRPEAFQFIRDVPTDWEQSIALDGEVGDYVVFTRQARDKADWYLGAITDEQARSIAVPLAFLTPGQTYLAQIYRDGDQADWQTQPYDLVIEERSVTHKDTLRFTMATSGGVAIRFKAH